MAHPRPSTSEMKWNCSRACTVWQQVTRSPSRGFTTPLVALTQRPTRFLSANITGTANCTVTCARLQLNTQSWSWCNVARATHAVRRFPGTAAPRAWHGHGRDTRSARNLRWPVRSLRCSRRATSFLSRVAALLAPRSVLVPAPGLLPAARLRDVGHFAGASIRHFAPPSMELDLRFLMTVRPGSDTCSGQDSGPATSRR